MVDEVEQLVTGEEVEELAGGRHRESGGYASPRGGGQKVRGAIRARGMAAGPGP